MGKSHTMSDQTLINTQNGSKLQKIHIVGLLESLLIQAIAECKNLLEIKPECIVFGKVRNQQRDVGFFSNVPNGYRYANQQSKTIPLTPTLSHILAIINAHFAPLGISFNGILLNRYNNGEDYVGPHSDKTDGLNHNYILTVGYGAMRKFRVIYKQTDEKITDILFNSGDAYLMSGNFQNEFKHSIVKCALSKCNSVRYSFTFRSHKI